MILCFRKAGEVCLRPRQHISFLPFGDAATSVIADRPWRYSDLTLAIWLLICDAIGQ